MTISGGWDSVREAVRLRIGESACETWFRSVAGSLDGQTLVLSCPNRFTRDWVRARYGRVIADVAPEVREIDYRVDERGEASRNEPPGTLPPERATSPRRPAGEPSERPTDRFADFVVDEIDRRMTAGRPTATRSVAQPIQPSGPIASEAADRQGETLV